MGFAVQSGKKRKITPVMNVTPLVDVVLVLLIIFMVVTPLLVKQMSVRVPEKPKDEAPAAPSSDVPIVVTAMPGGGATLNKAPIALEAIAAELQRLTAGRGDRIVFFAADAQTTYGDAVTVLDRAKSSGATVAVLTEQP